MESFFLISIFFPLFFICFRQKTPKISIEMMATSRPHTQRSLSTSFIPVWWISKTMWTHFLLLSKCPIPFLGRSLRGFCTTWICTFFFRHYLLNSTVKDKTKNREGQAASQQRNLLILQTLIEPPVCQSPALGRGIRDSEFTNTLPLRGLPAPRNLGAVKEMLTTTLRECSTNLLGPEQSPRQIASFVSDSVLSSRWAVCHLLRWEFGWIHLRASVKQLQRFMIVLLGTPR